MWPFFSLPPEQRTIEQTVYLWMASGDFQVPFMLRLDTLAAVMTLVVTGIGFLIHVYSLATCTRRSTASTRATSRT